MLKILDHSIGGLRLGPARFMDGRRVAQVGKLGPLSIGRRIVRDLEPGEAVDIEVRSSTLDDYSSGRSIQLEPTGEINLIGWAEDSLGVYCQILRTISPGKINTDPELRHYIYNPERR